ncbi:MAG: ribonuclease Z [Gammaproteobacteria bacterium]|nr:ribonuclease Z [Gammaproteobacteria bacterium]MDH5801114.1 ribonuclease Z [Gammaproteobacteria bacterium]
MQFTFLGTSSGVPTTSRNVSGLAIRCDDKKSWCLVDCGEATQHQLLRTSYSLAKLEAIFITHVHGDHCFGLPGLLASAAMNARRLPLVVVGPAPLKHFLDAALRATCLNLNYELSFIDVSSLQDSISAAGMDVSRVELSHRVPSYAYCFTAGRKKTRLLTLKLQQQGVPAGPLWGRLQSGMDVDLEDGTTLKSADYIVSFVQQQRVLVGGDNDSPQLLSAAEELDVIIHEATYDEATLKASKRDYGHSSAAGIAAYTQAAGVKNLVLTHFSPRYHGRENAEALLQLETEARQAFSGNLHLASDLDTFQLKEGELIKL